MTSSSQVPNKEPDPGLSLDWLCGTAEIAQMLAVSRQRVFQITSREDFPAPEVELHMGKVWRTEDVRRWAENDGRDTYD